jgi:hypothetical protein
LKKTIAVKNVKTSEIAENVSLKREGGWRDKVLSKVDIMLVVNCRKVKTSRWKNFELFFMKQEWNLHLSQ